MNYLAADFLARARDEFSVRLHARELDAGGAPEWHRALESYLTDGEDHWATTRSDDLIGCDHPTVACAPRCAQEHRHVIRGTVACPTCDGSGYRQRIRRRYVRPVKLSLRVLRETRWAPKDRPKLDALLLAFLLNDGNATMTAQSLRARYPYMWDRDRAERYIDYALREWRKVFCEEPDGSQSQSNATAA